MALSTTIYEPTYEDVNLTIRLSDVTVLKELKKAIKLFRGVENVKASPMPSRDITKTAGFAEAMDDKRQGRIFHAENVDDMFNQILG